MKKRTWPWLVVAVIALLMVSCCGCLVLSVLVSMAPRGASTGPGRQGTVAVIPVHGVIYSGENPGGLGASGAYSEGVLDNLKQAVENARIKAVVLDVDSPGGSVVASADIHRALAECPKPVVTSMGETAASGGYYIAAGTDYIVVRPATLTGSIGVIWEFTDASALLQKLGVELRSIKTGAFKDQGSIARPLTEQEVAMLQAIIDEAYGDFVKVIVEGRGLPESQVRSVADGRVFSGRQAITLGLADAEGNLDDAIAKAAELGGIEGEPAIYYYERVPNLRDILSGFTTRANHPPELVLLRELLGDGSQPSLQYLYRGE